MNVVILGEDTAALDLVAHFLGLATHDNINAAPSAVTPGDATPGPARPTVMPEAAEARPVDPAGEQAPAVADRLTFVPAQLPPGVVLAPWCTPLALAAAPKADVPAVRAGGGRADKAHGAP